MLQNKKNILKLLLWIGIGVAAALLALAALHFSRRQHSADGRCPLERISPAFRFYLICIPNGEAYPLDIFGRGDTFEDAEDTYSIILFGRDEASGSTLSVLKSPGRASALATLRRGDAPAVQPPDGLYCTGCLQKLTSAAAQSDLPTFILYDSDSQCVYSVDEFPRQLGDYRFEAISTETGYQIIVSWAP